MASKTPVIRPATRRDVLAWRGDLYFASLRGLAAEIDGEVVGVCGVLHTYPMQAFMEISPRMKSHKRALVQGIRAFREILDKYHEPIFCVASENEQTADAFIRHVGFTHLEGRIYQWKPQHFSR